MEPHKPLPASIKKYQLSLQDSPKEYFKKAYAFVKKFHRQELDFIQSTKFEKVDEDFFFKEYIWVVYASGFSAKVVSKMHPRLVDAFGYFDQLAQKEFDEIFEKVKPICRNKQKAKSVYNMAVWMSSELEKLLWVELKDQKLNSPEKLMKLPYIGKITCYHLARNIGLLEFVKPDLHLVRMAEHWGYEDCIKLCEAVRPKNMSLGVVDLILWYAASTFGTLEIKTSR